MLGPCNIVYNLQYGGRGREEILLFNKRILFSKKN